MDKLIIQLFSQEILHFSLKDGTLRAKIMGKAIREKFLCSCSPLAGLWNMGR